MLLCMVTKKPRSGQEAMEERNCLNPTEDAAVDGGVSGESGQRPPPAHLPTPTQRLSSVIHSVLSRSMRVTSEEPVTDNARLVFVTPRLGISSLFATFDCEVLHAAGITHVVTVGAHIPSPSCKCHRLRRTASVLAAERTTPLPLQRATSGETARDAPGLQGVSSAREGSLLSSSQMRNSIEPGRSEPFCAAGPKRRLFRKSCSEESRAVLAERGAHRLPGQSRTANASGGGGRTQSIPQCEVARYGDGVAAAGVVERGVGGSEGMPDKLGQSVVSNSRGCKAFTCLHVALLDNETANLLDELPRVLRFVEDSLRTSEEHKVLVHCFAGKSRSAAVLCAFLMKSEGISLEEALARIRKVRPIACPNPSFMWQLQRYEQSLKCERGRTVRPPAVS
ncbi:dual specificity protein phosphatase 1-like isoform x1 [Cystoisospora suis]|uniref:Dual specificity protein phosphatase 1-like isoform x1 n=1 Tax=Cystoisospora suis TaxID=483139 RepID=A0A2C6KZL3_9APIC|nr:dual specificity protein phosphatase 1-like isoform x1 [Cystoisospora suis]